MQKLTHALLVLASLLAGPALSQTTRPDAVLGAPSASAGERFGYSVALDGDRALVAAPYTTGAATNSGSAHVFERAIDGTWAQVAELVASTPINGAVLGRCVALDGDTAVCGSFQLGRLFVFERQSSGAWAEVAAFDPPSGKIAATGLAIDGDRIVAGFRGSAPSQFDQSGGIVVYERHSGTWSQVAVVSAVVGMDNDFGRRIDLDGDRAVVGSPLLGASSGAVFVFERVAGLWGPPAIASMPTLAEGDGLGYSVAIEGDRLWAGAIGRDLGAENGGSVCEFELVPGVGWQFMQELTPLAPMTDAFFGSALDATPGRLVVGASGYRFAGVNTGAAFVHQRLASGPWVERQTLLHEGAAAGDGLGSFVGDSVAIDGTRCLCGAAGVASQTGAAFVLDLARLHSDRATVSLASGGTQSLLLRGGGALAGDVYLVLGSFSGTNPGVQLAPGVVLPLVVDAYTQLGAALSSPVVGAFGVLDFSGAAGAALNVPSGTDPSFLGAVIHHAYLTIDVATFEVAVSNAVALTLVP